jgi:pimeloyl-ACP methyl ester carboxylesterase
MSSLHSFELAAADGKLIRGDRAEGKDRQILFITGFLSKRWGNKSKALAQWCEEKGWGFCCYDVRGFGESEGTFTDYTLSDWIQDARAVISTLTTGPPLTIVGNSLGGWIAWLMAQECPVVEKLVLIAPAFNMMGVRAKSISPERCHEWRRAGCPGTTSRHIGIFLSPGSGLKRARPCGARASSGCGRSARPFSTASKTA